jgi:hypothetical protein
LVFLCALGISKPITEFPLWGSTWIVADGSNKRIYPSVLPLIPAEIAVVRFVDDGFKKQVAVSWANLNYKDYWGTAEVVKDIETQIANKTIFIKIDSINARKGVDIAYQTYNDTVWSLNKAIIDSFGNNKYSFAEKVQGTVRTTYDRPRDGIERLNKEITDGTGYTKSKPSVWLRRGKNMNDMQDFTFEVEDESAGKSYYYRQTNKNDIKTLTENLNDGSDISIKSISNIDAGGDDITEYCDDHYYYKKIIDPKALDYKTANLGYWQVHIYPEVWYYPRDFTTGKPLIHDDLKLPFDSASARKSLSINNPNDNDLKYWRDPYLSDSASTIISFAFVEDGRMTERESIWLSGSAIGSKIAYEHFPPKMYNVGKFGQNNSAIRKAALMLYSNGENEEYMARTLETRCPGWAVYDEANARDLFPYRLRDGNVYKRDWSADDGIYRYDNCPCSKESALGGKTKAQIRKFILKPVPTCQYEDMDYALNFYKRMKYVLIAPQDQLILDSKIREIDPLIQKRADNYQRIIESRGIKITKQVIDETYANEFRSREQACPQTWVDIVRGLGL